MDLIILDSSPKIWKQTSFDVFDSEMQKSTKKKKKTSQYEKTLQSFNCHSSKSTTKSTLNWPQTWKKRLFENKPKARAANWITYYALVIN